MKSCAPASFAGGFDFLVGRVELAVAQVLADRAAEQVRRLQHHADARLNRVLRHVGVVDAADRSPARRVGSKKRQIRLTTVDLPAPVGPTSAIVSPRLTVRLKLCSTGLSYSLS